METDSVSVVHFYNPEPIVLVRNQESFQSDLYDRCWRRSCGTSRHK